MAPERGEDCEARHTDSRSESKRQLTPCSGVWFRPRCAAVLCSAVYDMTLSGGSAIILGGGSEQCCGVVRQTESAVKRVYRLETWGITHHLTGRVAVVLDHYIRN